MDDGRSWSWRCRGLLTRVRTKFSQKANQRPTPRSRGVWTPSCSWFFLLLGLSPCLRTAATNLVPSCLPNPPQPLFWASHHWLPTHRAWATSNFVVWKRQRHSEATTRLIPHSIHCTKSIVPSQARAEYGQRGGRPVRTRKMGALVLTAALE